MQTRPNDGLTNSGAQEQGSACAALLAGVPFGQDRQGASEMAPLHGRQGTARSALYRYAVVFTLVLFIVGFSLLLPRTFFTSRQFSHDRQLPGRADDPVAGSHSAADDRRIRPFDRADARLRGGAHRIFCGPASSSLAAVIIATVLVGVLAGLLNAFFVVRVGVNAFIATLGVSTMITGLTLAVSDGQILNTVPQPLVDFVQHQFFGLAVPVYIAFALAIALWRLYEHTPLGRHLFFVGEGREAARLVGLKVDRLRAGAFVASGAISAIAGVFTAGQLGAADPSVGPNFLLPAYAAAFLGATTIKPGRFNAWGTVVALYLLVTGVTGLELLGTSSWVQEMFNGVALLIAVTFARFVAREQAA